MSALSQHILIVFISVGVVYASPKLNDVLDKNDCEPSPENHIFDEAKAVGIWYNQPTKSKKNDPLGNSDSVQLSALSEQEREDLKQLIGKYVENLKWENLTLKMQNLYRNSNNNLTNIYYLERLEGDGFYRTLNMPSSTAKLDFGSFRRYPIRLKIIENEYLAIFDCHMFLMSKEQFDNTKKIERIQKINQLYWPEN